MYSLTDVLAVAKKHPFYSPAQFSPEDEAIRAARKEAALNTEGIDLKAQPLLRKEDLYTVIQRLVNDTNPENTYRDNVYTSITGGGNTLSAPLFFATDALENRRHRAYFGEFLKKVGVIKQGDWVLTTHCGGDLYRSLDLTLEILENAGASVLAAGNHCPPVTVVRLLQDFSVNVRTGDGSQIVSVVHQISTLTEGREKIKLDKIIRSAEAGPYGASTPDLTPCDPSAIYNDFVIDTRMTLIEILPFDHDECDRLPEPLPEGETGVIVQTVLTRPRNPVIRYLTGDVGSLHYLPDKAHSQISKTDWPYFRILRLQGRDRRFSFMWDGIDIRFDNLTTLLSEAKYGILQWQVILDKMVPSLEISLEIRLLYSQQTPNAVSREDVVDRLRKFFTVYSSNEHRFTITFVDELNGFELSKTGRKVIKFVDRST
ncbi:hypothetical protein ACHAP5_010279 [Fusarium lateritium]